MGIPQANIAMKQINKKVPENMFFKQTRRSFQGSGSPTSAISPNLVKDTRNEPNNTNTMVIDCYPYMRRMRTSPILVAKIWKAPNVAETNGDGDAGEEEVKLVRKRSPLGIVVLRYKISTVGQGQQQQQLKQQHHHNFSTQQCFVFFFSVFGITSTVVSASGRSILS